MLSGQLDTLRKKERLRELFDQQVDRGESADLSSLAAALGPAIGVEETFALTCLSEFVAERLQTWF